MDILREHGLFNVTSGINKEKELELQKELANLSAYVDIDERTTGSVGKFYDLFDNSNDHSVGLIDTTKITKNGLTTGQTTISITAEELSGFATGQEVSIQDDVNLERALLSGASLNEQIGTVDHTTPVEVVNQGYSTEGNGGRKIVRLDNGWIVVGVKDGLRLKFYKSTNEGQSFELLFDKGNFTSLTDFSISSKGNILYYILGMESGSKMVTMYAHNVETDTPIQSLIYIDTNQTEIDECSLAINDLGTELHACWLSKNSTYANSWNTRYCKGTINSETGEVTWGNVEQVTTHNSASYQTYELCMVVKDNAPYIIVRFYNSNPTHYIAVFTNAYATQTFSTSSSWGNHVVYNGGSYAQSAPSVDTLSDGTIIVAWEGKDATNTLYPVIKFSKSSDNGVTWDSAITIVDNTYETHPPSITRNQSDNIFVMYYANLTLGREIGLVEFNGSWQTPVDLGIEGRYPNTCNNYRDFEKPFTIFSGGDSANVKFYGKFTGTVQNPQLTLSTPLANTYKNNAIISRSNCVVENGKLKMGIYEDNTTYDIQNSVVINSDYDTSGNGGRRLVRMDNGVLICITNRISDGTMYLYKSIDNGTTWGSHFAYIGNRVNTSCSIVSHGNFVYVLYNAPNYSKVYFVKIDVENAVSNYNYANERIEVDVNQNNFSSGISLVINNNKTELHACWSSKNPLYPNSFNIRYCKGIIDGNNNVTWGDIDQVTRANVNGVDFQKPSIMFDGNYAIIITERPYGSTYYITALSKRNIGSIVDIVDGWYGKNIYNGGSYTQSNPSTIFIPQSINGLPNGCMWCVWHGKDNIDTTVNNIRVSYSNDFGVTWSTMEKLTSGNSHSSSHPSIIVNKNNDLWVLYRDDANGTISKIKNIDGSWGISNFACPNGQNVSSLNDITLEFTEPLFIRQGNSIGVYFSGTLITNEDITLYECDIRYNINPPVATNEIVTWVEKEIGLNIGVKVSIHNNGENENYVSMVESQDGEFVQTFGTSKNEGTLKLTLSGDNTKAITKILGAVGE